MKKVKNCVDRMVQNGAMDAATRGKPGDYVTLDFRPTN